ncbi:LysR family transcriptional regulator [Propionivibrio sp.]|uniref:LysR family transcriptional regulator n=1 Tax=Propionivibrio sp. TaxID=2212460 RepID=UPI0039E5F72F
MPSRPPGSTTQLLNRLRMRQVALILAIDEARTLRGAAESLGMTQSAASQMLHELEETLGEPLFDRVGRGLQLNPAGQVVLHSFRNLRNNMAALTHELHELQLGGSGKLLVGCIMVAVPTHLCTAIVNLKKAYPLLSIEIVVDTSDRLVRMLRDGTLDVVIGRMPVANGSLEQDCLFHSIGGEVIVMVAAADHPLLRPAKKQISFKALLSYPWILQPRGSPSREVIEQELLAHHAAPPLGLVETTSILVAANLLAFENMIAAIPLSIARPYEQHGILKILPYAFKHTLTDWGCIVHRDRTVGPTTQEFLRLMSSRC